MSRDYIDSSAGIYVFCYMCVCVRVCVCVCVCVCVYVCVPGDTTWLWTFQVGIKIFCSRRVVLNWSSGSHVGAKTIWHICFVNISDGSEDSSWWLDNHLFIYFLFYFNNQDPFPIVTLSNLTPKELKTSWEDKEWSAWWSRWLWPLCQRRHLSMYVDVLDLWVCGFVCSWICVCALNCVFFSHGSVESVLVHLCRHKNSIRQRTSWGILSVDDMFMTCVHLLGCYTSNVFPFFPSINYAGLRATLHVRKIQKG